MKRVFLRGAISAVIASGLCWASSPEAAVLLKCGPASGYSYYIAGGIVPEEGAGWREDGITDGRTNLVQDGADFDIVFRDAFGEEKSSLADGAQIVVIKAQPGLVFLLAIYLGEHRTVEHYLFRWDASRRGEVVWGTVRSSSIITKSSLYHAQCSVP